MKRGDYKAEEVEGDLGDNTNGHGSTGFQAIDTAMSYLGPRVGLSDNW
jgi:hypothetical protein